MLQSIFHTWGNNNKLMAKLTGNTMIPLSVAVAVLGYGGYYIGTWKKGVEDAVAQNNGATAALQSSLTEMQNDLTTIKLDVRDIKGDLKRSRLHAFLPEKTVAKSPETVKLNLSN